MDGVTSVECEVEEGEQRKPYERADLVLFVVRGKESGHLIIDGEIYLKG